MAAAPNKAKRPQPQPVQKKEIESYETKYTKLGNRDFYKILKIQRCATDEEISTNYKKLALKNHPLKNAEHMEIHLEKFHDICEAYEVLINPQWKAIYD